MGPVGAASPFSRPFSAEPKPRTSSISWQVAAKSEYLLGSVWAAERFIAVIFKRITPSVSPGGGSELSKPNALASGRLRNTSSLPFTGLLRLVGKWASAVVSSTVLAWETSAARYLE